MKDHEVAGLVNRLVSVARIYGHTQQLRQRIAIQVYAALNPKSAVAERVDNDDFLRSDCPVTAGFCEYYAYQCDRNGAVAIEHCSHQSNPRDTEGNTLNNLCPLISTTGETQCRPKQK